MEQQKKPENYQQHSHSSPLHQHTTPQTGSHSFVPLRKVRNGHRETKKPCFLQTPEAKTFYFLPRTQLYLTKSEELWPVFASLMCCLTISRRKFLEFHQETCQKRKKEKMSPEIIVLAVLGAIERCWCWFLGPLCASSTGIFVVSAFLQRVKKARERRSQVTSRGRSKSHNRKFLSHPTDHLDDNDAQLGRNARRRTISKFFHNS